jgi:DNA-binding CsgD family transcriptional regulator
VYSNNAEQLICCQLHSLGGQMATKQAEKSQSVDIALVLGFLATKDLATAEKKIAILTQLGYSNTDMAKICGKTPGVIKTLKSNLKKGGNNG